MYLQKKVIYQFKAKFPNATLKTVSSLTGIQVTRVFRIFNGQEMKLKEYESFQTALSENSTNQSIQLNGGEKLGNKEKEFLNALTENALRWSQYRYY